MTDITSDSVAARRMSRSATTSNGANGAQRPPQEDASPVELVAYVELLFFAYRDFVGDADHELEAFGFGRAHHRVLHFVHRYPGLKVADLLDVLRITKQSLGRVLKQLLDDARGNVEAELLQLLGYLPLAKVGPADFLPFGTARGVRLHNLLEGLV